MDDEKNSFVAGIEGLVNAVRGLTGDVEQYASTHWGIGDIPQDDVKTAQEALVERMLEHGSSVTEAVVKVTDDDGSNPRYLHAYETLGTGDQSDQLSGPVKVEQINEDTYNALLRGQQAMDGQKPENHQNIGATDELDAFVKSVEPQRMKIDPDNDSGFESRGDDSVNRDPGMTPGIETMKPPLSPDEYKETYGMDPSVLVDVHLDIQALDTQKFKELMETQFSGPDASVQGSPDVTKAALGAPVQQPSIEPVTLQNDVTFQ